MGPIILIFVLLHALSSYWQLRKQPREALRQGDATVRMFVRVVICIKEYVILPAIVLMLLMYSFDNSAMLWLKIEWLGFVWIHIVGLACIVASIPLKVRAYAVLGKNWSASPTVYEDHSLITEGPYKWVQHPVYTSNIIMLLGAFLATNSITFLIMGVVYFATDVVRGNEEGEKLAERFGESYTQYVATVGGYVPKAVTLSFVCVVILCNIVGITNELLFILTGYSFTAMR